MATGALCATAVILPILGAGAAQATNVNALTPLTLKNGWTNAPFGTSNAAVTNVSGIVHFKGAIATSGTNAVPFTLPLAFRPAKNVFIPVDLCNATNGRLFIAPNGVVTVQAGNFSNAQCFTSLDGAQFAKAATSFTSLTLKNGWTNAPFATSNAAVRNINGVIYFKGAIATSGTNAVPFTLPKAFRPATAVYVKVDLCNATNGRLFIAPNGVVTVQAGARQFRDRHLQGGHRDRRHQRGSVHPAGGLPSRQERLRPGGPVQRHQRAPRHHAQRPGDRGGGGRDLLQRPVLHLARRGLVPALIQHG